MDALQFGTYRDLNTMEGYEDFITTYPAKRHGRAAPRATPGGRVRRSF